MPLHEEIFGTDAGPGDVVLGFDDLAGATWGSIRTSAASPGASQTASRAAFSFWMASSIVLSATIAAIICTAAR